MDTYNSMQVCVRLREFFMLIRNWINAQGPVLQCGALSEITVGYMTRLILLRCHSAALLTTSRSEDVIRLQLRGTRGEKQSAVKLRKHHWPISWRVSKIFYLVCCHCDSARGVKNSRVISEDDTAGVQIIWSLESLSFSLHRQWRNEGDLRNDSWQNKWIKGKTEHLSRFLSPHLKWYNNTEVILVPPCTKNVQKD